MTDFHEIANRLKEGNLTPEEKICSKCKEKKLLSEYYKDKRAKDGLFSACKLCHYKTTKPYTTRWRLNNRERARENVRKSYSRPEYKVHQREYARKWRKENPVKAVAWSKTEEARAKNRTRLATRYWVKKGKLKKLACQVCGDENSHAHHPDYKRALLVVWLCRKHHMELHRK